MKRMRPLANVPRRLVPPADARYARHERGWLAYWQLAPNAYATCANGQTKRDMSSMLIEHGERLYEGDRIVYGFHDWLDMTHYESACRIDLTNWILSHRKQSVLHIAVSSPVIAMGVTVANMVLDTLIHIHKSAAALDQAYAEAADHFSRA
jgi:hypothetical protein